MKTSLRMSCVSKTIIFIGACKPNYSHHCIFLIQNHESQLEKNSIVFRIELKIVLLIPKTVNKIINKKSSLEFYFET